MALPRPLKKRAKPESGPVTLRKIGRDDAVEVVAPGELERRKEEAQWEQYRRAHGFENWGEHERLALKLGEPFRVPVYTQDLWWFVRDVNGIDRTVTGGTLLFDQPRERTFPFEMVETFRLWNVDERSEAALWWARVQGRLGPITTRNCPARAA